MIFPRLLCGERGQIDGLSPAAALAKMPFSVGRVWVWFKVRTALLFQHRTHGDKTLGVRVG